SSPGWHQFGASDRSLGGGGEGGSSPHFFPAGRGGGQAEEPPEQNTVRWRPGKPMTKKRRSYEAGHSPKFMVVIDDSPECDRGLYFASRRALRVGAPVIMLRVIETRDRNPQWLGVADIMRAEAHEEANAVLDRHAARSSSITGVMPQRVIREGDKAQEVLNLIEDDEDIAALVLAAANSLEGP